MKHLFNKALTLCVASLLVAPQFAMAQRNFDAIEIEATQVADNIYMLTGSGGNIGVIIGEDG